MSHMTMKDYAELRAAQEGAEMMREAIAIQIADKLANNDDVPKELVRQYRVSQLAVESNSVFAPPAFRWCSPCAPLFYRFSGNFR